MEILLIVAGGRSFNRMLRNSQASWIAPLSDIAKAVVLRLFGNAGANKLGYLEMMFVRVLDVVLIS